MTEGNKAGITIGLIAMALIATLAWSSWLGNDRSEVRYTGPAEPTMVPRERAIPVLVEIKERILFGLRNSPDSALIKIWSEDKRYILWDGTVGYLRAVLDTANFVLEEHPQVLEE